jgi:hypothetical protein
MLSKLYKICMYGKRIGQEILKKNNFHKQINIKLKKRLVGEMQKGN